MRHLTYKLTSALMVLLLAALVSCDTLSGDPDLPIPLAETMSNTGGFLRVTSVTVAGFDFSNLDEAEYVFTGEFFDEQEGELLENVVFSASYSSVDFSSPDGSPEIPFTEFRTVPASEFSPSEQSGLPSKEFVITLDEVLAALNLDQANIELGDEFRIAWTVNMTNGKSFDRFDASPAVNGGFYSSPYLAISPVAFVIPSDLFIGSYTITQNGTGPIINPLLSDMEFTAELIIDPSNTLNGRRFAFDIYGTGSGFGSDNLRLALTRGLTQPENTATLPGDFSLGLTCGGAPEGIVWGPITDPGTSDFDVADDSQFTFVLQANKFGDCSAGSPEVTFTATKN